MQNISTSMLIKVATSIEYLRTQIFRNQHRFILVSATEIKSMYYKEICAVYKESKTDYTVVYQL